MTDLDADLAQLRAAYPDLPYAGVESIASGQYNRVLLLDDMLIARFPRFAAGAAHLAFETTLLDALRPHSPVPIPDFRYRQLSPGDGAQPFVVYRKLNGEPLGRELLATRDRATRRRIAATLGGFLRALHNLPLDTLGPVPSPLAYGFTAATWLDGWRDLADRVQRAVLPRVAPATAARIAAAFAPFITTVDDFAPPLTLIHGDFGGGNILIDRTTGTVSGVLDFGATGLGDPACDLAALLSYGDHFAEVVLAAHPALRPALPRAHAYRATFAAQEALYGAEQGNPEAFARGIAPYATAEPVNCHA